MTPRVLVLSGFGINGELEMAESFRLAGGNAEVVHVEDLVSGKKSLDDYEILAFPGGFSYGDDLGAGVALANRLRNNLGEELEKFVARDTLTFGICNGFQMMVNLGILPRIKGKEGERSVALRHNKAGMYQCRWTNVRVESEKCVFLKGLDVLPLSVGHGEGNFFADEETLKELNENDQVALRYCYGDGEYAGGDFPVNPNGSMEDIAGICDDSGRIFGLMPHPDRFLTAYHDDLWTLKKEVAKRNGQEFNENSIAKKIYLNAVNYFD